jgi:hypothetical protein
VEAAEADCAVGQPAPPAPAAAVARPKEAGGWRERVAGNM